MFGKGCLKMKIDLNKISSNAADDSFLSLMGGKGIVDLPIEDIIETKNQPFKVLDDERMNTLVEDIKINGVLEPIIVKEEDGKYRILAGHRRTHASRLAGKKSVPSIIMNVKPGTEKLIITNTNFSQREGFSPSELAKGYKMQQEGYKELGVHSVCSTAQIAEDNNVSRRTVQYYLKLNDLIEPLLNLVDEEIITVKAGAQLSKLSIKEQELLRKYLIGAGIKKLDLNYAISIIHQSEKVKSIDIDYLEKLFFPDKNDELKYDSYIINNQDIDNILFPIRKKIIEFDNLPKLKNTIVLKKKNYQKLLKAQKAIEKQLDIINQIIDKS